MWCLYVSSILYMHVDFMLYKYTAMIFELIIFQFLRNHMIHTPTYLRPMDNKWRYRCKTMAGDWIDMKRKSHDSPVIINDNAKVIESDTHAINGVLHKVDSVFSCTCIE